MIVDGEVIAGRGRSSGDGFMKRLFGGGFPDPEEVVARIEELQRQKSGS